MSTDDSKIPLLEDLIRPGDTHQLHSTPSLGEDDSQSLQIPNDEGGPDIELDDSEDDRFKDDANMKELIIDEEIRMILDRHMENAYEEIVRLLNRRIC